MKLSEKKIGKWANWSNPEVEEEQVENEETVAEQEAVVEEEASKEEEAVVKIEEESFTQENEQVWKAPDPVANVQSVKQEEKKSRFVGVDDQAAETKRIWYFLGLVFVFSWFVEIGAIIPMYKSGDAASIKEASKMIQNMLFAPTFAAVFARALTREGFSHTGFQFNIGNHKIGYFLGWFGMTILAFLGAILYFVIFRENFDPDMTNFVKEQMENPSKEDAIQLVAAFKTNLLIQCMTAPVLDVINSLGEEWGWRAYLLPKLYRKFGTIPAVLLSGFLSGLWYAPLVTIGYFSGNFVGTEYIGAPVSGVILMCLFGTFTGIIYATLSLTTGSIFPATFAHSAMTIMMTQSVYFSKDGGNLFVGPQASGIIGGLPIIIAAAGCLYYLKKHPVKSSQEKKA